MGALQSSRRWLKIVVILFVVQTDDMKETKRLQALERKAQLYDELQKRVNLDDEAANDLHEVDFIAKALESRDHSTEQAATVQSFQLQEFLGNPMQSNDPLRESFILLVHIIFHGLKP